MTDLINVVRCLKCADTTHILYLGETGRTFESRITDHECDWATRPLLAVTLMTANIQVWISESK